MAIVIDEMNAGNLALNKPFMLSENKKFILRNILFNNFSFIKLNKPLYS